MAISKALAEYTFEAARRDLTDVQKQLQNHFEVEFDATHTLLTGENEFGCFPELSFKFGKRNVVVITNPYNSSVSFHAYRGMWPFRQLELKQDHISRKNHTTNESYFSEILRLARSAAKRAQRMSPQEYSEKLGKNNVPMFVDANILIRSDVEVTDKIKSDYADTKDGDVRVWIVNASTPNGFIGFAGEFIDHDVLKNIDAGVSFYHDGINFYYSTDNPKSFTDAISGCKLTYPQPGMPFIACETEPKLFSPDVQNRIDEWEAKKKRT